MIRFITSVSLLALLAVPVHAGPVIRRPHALDWVWEDNAL